MFPHYNQAPPSVTQDAGLWRVAQASGLWILGPTAETAIAPGDEFSLARRGRFA